MKTYCLFLFLCSYVQITKAQTLGCFALEAGGYDWGAGILQTYDGGVLVSGRTSSTGSDLQYDIYIAKISSTWNIEWTLKVGGSSVSSNDLGYKAVQTADSGYAVIGIKDFGGAQDIVVIRIDKYGTVEWSNTYGWTGNDWGYSISSTSDNGFLLSGTTEGNFDAPGGLDMYLIKTDSIGNVEWSSAIGTSGTEWGYNASIVTGGYIITGRTNTLGSEDMYVAKVDFSGNLLWTKIIGSDTGQEYGYSVKEDSQQNIVVGGFTNSSSSVGSEDFYIASISFNGDSVYWSKSIGGVNNDFVYDVLITPSNDYLFVGWTNSFGYDPGSKYDMYVVKVNIEGDIEWAKTLGFSNSDDWAYGACSFSTSNYCFIGRSEIYGDDIFISYINLLDTSCCSNNADYDYTSFGDVAEGGDSGGSCNVDQWGELSSGGSLDTLCLDIMDSTLLPIQLVSFQGEYVNNGVKMNWETATESDIDYFSLERSLDSGEGSFEEIAKIDALNILSGASYNFFDNTLSSIHYANGQVYYSLNVVDENNQKEFISTISVELNNKQNESLILTMNNDEELHVFLNTSNNGFYNITINNMSGKNLYKALGTKDSNAFFKNINVSSFSSGVYIVKLDINSKIYTGKISIN